MPSTNTAPDPEILAVEERVNGRRKRVVPDDTMKKPKVVKAYNGGKFANYWDMCGFSFGKPFSLDFQGVDWTQMSGSN